MHTKMLSCDWGTTSFRLRLIDTTTGNVIDESVSDEGIRAVYNEWVKAGASENDRKAFYLAVIARHIEALAQQQPAMQKQLPVIVSGMASSTIGIKELPYTPVPFFTDGRDILVETIEKTDCFPHDLSVISGACTDADVMRGEETQLVGCAGDSNTATQLLIFPGTHSKHVATKGGRATDIATYMTGELFSLLSEQSILSASVQAGGSTDEEAAAAFRKGVAAGQKQSLSHELFQVRTNQLFNRFSKQANFYYLSGLLIGAELGALSAKAVETLTLVGEKKLLNNYLTAFDVLGIRAPVKILDAATATIRGQLAIYRRLYA